MCKHDWQQTVHYADLYQNFDKQYQQQGKSTTQQKTYYNILTYKLEAFCQLNRIEKAYELLHELVGSVDYTDSSLFECCTSSVQRINFIYHRKRINLFLKNEHVQQFQL